MKLLSYVQIFIPDQNCSLIHLVHLPAKGFLKRDPFNCVAMPYMLPVDVTLPTEIKTHISTFLSCLRSDIALLLLHLLDTQVLFAILQTQVSILKF